VQWWERSWVRSSLSADLRGEGLPWFFPSPDLTHVGASGTGSVFFFFWLTIEHKTLMFCSFFFCIGVLFGVGTLFKLLIFSMLISTVHIYRHKSSWTCWVYSSCCTSLPSISSTCAFWEVSFTSAPILIFEYAMHLSLRCCAVSSIILTGGSTLFPRFTERL